MKTNVNENNKEISDEDLRKFYCTAAQCIDKFKLVLSDMMEDMGQSWGHDPSELLSIEDPTECLAYIWSDEHWLREWSNFLLYQIGEIIYGDVTTEK